MTLINYFNTYSNEHYYLKNSDLIRLLTDISQKLIAFLTKINLL